MLDFLETPLTVLHIFVAFFLVLVVLIQPGKSGGIGAALGGAGAQQVFGGRGAGNFLSKLTWVSASIFFLTSMTLAYLSSSSDDSLADRAEAAVIAAPPESAPAAPVDGAQTSEEVADQPGEGAEPNTGTAEGNSGTESDTVGNSGTVSGTVGNSGTEGAAEPTRDEANEPGEEASPEPDQAGADNPPVDNAPAPPTSAP